MADAASLRSLIACIDRYPPEGIDWDRLIALANRTLTTGTLAEAMKDCTRHIPAEAATFLAAVRERAAERNARLAAQLDEAAALLNRAGIRPMPFKGATMLCEPWRAAGAGRLLSDLDIMVPQSAMASAEACLAAAGYVRQDPGISPPNAVTLFRECDVGAIDLHCRIKAHEIGCDFEALLPHCSRHQLDEGSIWLPSPTLQAVMLVAHDQLQDRDYWRGDIDLRHLIDLKLLAATGGGIDWAVLASFFPKGYPHAALMTQLVTLAHIARVAVPPQLSTPLWPRLQFGRRILQMRWPILASPLTLLTLALDPPFRNTAIAATGRQPGLNPRTHGFAAYVEELQRRFLRPRPMGKV